MSFVSLFLIRIKVKVILLITRRNTRRCPGNNEEMTIPSPTPFRAPTPRPLSRPPLPRVYKSPLPPPVPHLPSPFPLPPALPLPFPIPPGGERGKGEMGAYLFVFSTILLMKSEEGSSNKNIVHYFRLILRRWR